MEEKINAILSKVNEDLLNYDGENMVEEEVIDSFEQVCIIEQLEDEFDIEIRPEFVTAENFGNKERIIDFIDGLMNVKDV